MEYADALGSPTNWLPLNTVDLTAAPQLYLDVSAPLPPQRFYRVWQTGTPAAPPSLNLPFMVPAITLTGNMGDQLRLDYINQFGPTDAWVNLDTVTLTNTSQLYFDMSAPEPAAPALPDRAGSLKRRLAGLKQLASIFSETMGGGSAFRACKKRYGLGNFVPEFRIDGRRRNVKLSARFVKHFYPKESITKLWQ